MKLTIYGNGRSIFEQPLKESETSIKKKEGVSVFATK